MLCIISVNAAEEDWKIHQIDVKSAYLQALLKETIYMRPPCVGLSTIPVYRYDRKLYGH